MGRKPKYVTNVVGSSLYSKKCKVCGKHWDQHWVLNKGKKIPKKCKLKRMDGKRECTTRIQGLHVRASSKSATNKTYIVPGCSSCNALGKNAKDPKKKYPKFVVDPNWLFSASQSDCVGKRN